MVNKFLSSSIPSLADIVKIAWYSPSYVDMQLTVNNHCETRQNWSNVSKQTGHEILLNKPGLAWLCEVYDSKNQDKTKMGYCDW